VTLLAGAGLVAAYVCHARRAVAPLVDVRLFTGRAFTSAAATNLVLGVALFAVMLLLPLYLQVVRGESALTTGLLLVPQGVGAALAMPIAGGFTDRLGARRVVLTGIALALAGVAVLTQLTAGTSYVVFGGALALVGAGLGATITPAMAAGFRDLEPRAMPQASSAMATVQRLAGSVGPAVLAGVLQHQLRVRLPGFDGDIGDAAALAAREPDAVLPHLADAFAATFVVALGLAAVGAVVACFLPGRAVPPARAGSESPREENDMAVELNHTIVPARDKHASAAFLAGILGLPVGGEVGPFVQLELGNGVTLDFMDREELPSQHYAFLVDDEVFDAAYARLREAGVPTWADPDHEVPGEINTRWGGRGVYFPDPVGHNMEILTRAPS
jgi:MFS family permease